MSGLKPLGPAYPANPVRPVSDKEQAPRRRKSPASGKRRRKDGDGPEHKVDEYA